MKRQKLEKLSDRATGIAIASLILVFSLPLGKIRTVQNWSQSVPHLVIFVFSFLMIMAFWTAQSKIIYLITNPALPKEVVWLSRLYFFFLVLLPLSSGWMADNPYLPASILLYSCNLLIISLSHLLLLNCTLKFNYKQHQRLTDKLQNSLKTFATTGPALYVVSIGFSYINAYLSFFALIAGSCVYFFLLNKRARSSKAIIHS